MLEITIPGKEHFDEKTNRFLTVDDVTLELEHSLVSLSKWEEMFEIPFLSDGSGKDERTPEQTFAYIKLMTLTPGVPDEVYGRLTQENVKQISEYIDRKMTATWFTERPNSRGPRSSEIITAELIYYWMTALQIPYDRETWHLKKLLTLIQVAMLKNQPAKKMNPKEAMQQQRALNAQRQAQHGTTG